MDYLANFYIKYLGTDNVFCVRPFHEDDKFHFQYLKIDKRKHFRVFINNFCQLLTTTEHFTPSYPENNSISVSQCP